MSLFIGGIAVLSLATSFYFMGLTDYILNRKSDKYSRIKDVICGSVFIISFTLMPILYCNFFKVLCYYFNKVMS